jgi:putative MATE family efflux protein
MKDLTRGSVTIHLLTIAAPVALSMLAQIAYQVVDIYFIARISVAATAGVNAAGNVILVIAALTQVLGVGSAALIAHAVGRNDRADANLLFNQTLVLSVLSGIATTTVLYAATRSYLHLVAADSATVEAGAQFMFWVLPGYALMFPLVTVNSALRGIGLVQVPMAIVMSTVVVNALLAPVLIAGWGTGAPLGVQGAGLATTISVVIGFVALGVYVQRAQRYLSFDSGLLHPRLEQWRRVLRIGLPTGGEHAFTFLSVAIVYYAIRDFGVSAQAGFGIGWRVLQVLVLPGFAIAFAVGPIAGQSFGANDSARVRETFLKAALLGSAIMAAATLLLQYRPEALLSMFDADASTVGVAARFLQLVSWTLVAQGLIYTCSNMFRSLGNTVPSLISSGARFLAFGVALVCLSAQPEARIDHVWHLWNASIALQGILSLWLLRLEFKRCLPSVDAEARGMQAEA